MNKSNWLGLAVGSKTYAPVSVAPRHTSVSKTYAPAVASATVYKLRGVTYLPHYSKKCYVGPGYGVVRDRKYPDVPPSHTTREFLVEELLAAGAVREQMVLWLGVENSFRVCAEVNE